MTEKKEYKADDLNPFPGKASITFLGRDDSGLSGLSINVYVDGKLLKTVETDEDGKVEVKGLSMGEFAVSIKSEAEQKEEQKEEEKGDEKLARKAFDPEEDGFLSWPFSEDGEVKLLAKSSHEPGMKADITASNVASKGDLVSKLQKALSSLGYDLGSGGADGSFGEKTRKAVMEFQKGHTYYDGSNPYSSSDPDGIVGQETAFALDRALRVKRNIAKEELTEPAKLTLSLGRLEEEREFTVKIVREAVEFKHQIKTEAPILVPLAEIAIHAGG